MQQIIISLLSSSRGPLQPTNKLAYQDIKVGIPSVLLCIEMSIFAVLHLFAFPYKGYMSENGETPKYKGGPFGVLALLNAANPWDIIKASARGFRWLFVGIRHREKDSSYQSPVKAAGGYNGPTFAGTGEAATELQPGTEVDPRQRMRPSRDDVHGPGSPDDDRRGLLGDSAQIGRMRSASPYRTDSHDEYTTGDDSHLDLGAPNQHQRGGQATAFDAKGSDYGAGEEYTSYHPGIGPSSLHPALRGEETPPESWDPWDGARRGDAQSVRPPTYRTNDPQG